MGLQGRPWWLRVVDGGLSTVIAIGLLPVIFLLVLIGGLASGLPDVAGGPLWVAVLFGVPVGSAAAAGVAVSRWLKSN